MGNPIDFLATGTADQLGIIIDYCEFKFSNIDAMVVVFGSAGLFDVENVYKVLNVKLDIAKKPIYPVLPSVISAAKEIKYFLSKGRVNFPDEVVLGKALCEVYHTQPPIADREDLPEINHDRLREILDRATNGIQPPEIVEQLLFEAGIPYAHASIAFTKEEAVAAASKIGYPVVMKVTGISHKSDVGGVALNIHTPAAVELHFARMTQIKGAKSVMIQQMLHGTELFVGAKFEPKFGHLVLCGLGGIFIEVIKDVTVGLSPLNRKEVKRMIRRLKGYPVIEGIRGQPGVDKELFSDIILRVSALVEAVPEITEMDINPLLGVKDRIIAVDARILIDKG